MSTKRLRDCTLEDVFGPLRGEPTQAQRHARQVFAWYPFALFGACAALFVGWHLWGAFIRHHAGCP